MEQKWGWKVCFILWHFLIRGQITELLTFLPLRLKCNATLFEDREPPFIFLLGFFSLPCNTESTIKSGGTVFSNSHLGWFVHHGPVTCKYTPQMLVLCRYFTKKSFEIFKTFKKKLIESSRISDEKGTHFWNKKYVNISG